MSKELSPEELMKPRYKVIADYPEQYRPIGHIFDVSEPGVTCTHPAAWFDKYPHLFKRLEWHEDRKPEEMPKYVKGVSEYFKGRVFKVADPSQNGRIWHVEGEIEHRFAYNNSFIPATEAEYQSFLTLTNQSHER